MTKLTDIGLKIKQQNKQKLKQVDDVEIEKFADKAVDGAHEDKPANEKPVVKPKPTEKPWEQFDSSRKAKANRHIQIPVSDYELAIWNWIVDNDEYERSGRKLGRSMFFEKVLKPALDKASKSEK